MSAIASHESATAAMVMDEEGSRSWCGMWEITYPKSMKTSGAVAIGRIRDHS